MLPSDLRQTQVLFHGYKELKYLSKALVDNRMAGSSVQRYWDDGLRRKDDNPEYNGSKWMKGLSLTRDIRFAQKWGKAVVALDAEAIRRKHRIIPYNWGFSIPSGNHHKREREEFAVTHMGDTYRDGDRMDTKRFMEPEGSIGNLNDIILGIWLSRWVESDDGQEYELSDHYRNNLADGGKTYDDVISHEKFRGFY